MIKLKEILSGLRHDKPKVQNVNVKYLSCNSKDIKKNSLFVAIKGKVTDGHKFIQKAILKGAHVIVCEKDFKSSPSVIKIIVQDSKKALSILANNFYKTNSKKVKLIGITGTNGKTTISMLAESILSQASFRTALIGTLGHRINGRRFIKLNNTTPGALELHSLLNRAEKNSANFVIMEVSSHALSQYRTKGLKFQAAIFSNLSREHLDYHKNMKNYLKAKTRLFKELSTEALAIINKDDESFKYIKKATKAKTFTYALRSEADFVARNIQLNINRSQFLLKTPTGEIPIRTRLLGFHNIYNILAASSLAYCEGVKLDDIKKGIEALIGIPGRLQGIQGTQSFKVFVDYAHTPDALENVLRTLKKLTTADSKIITVFGCGGERDKTKRPKMAKVARRYSDFIIITSDNPRGENPLNILKDIERGFSPKDFKIYQIISDREKAIKKAFKIAKKGDVVLIAGKGHEDRQIFRDKIIPFSDIKKAKEILKEYKTYGINR